MAGFCYRCGNALTLGRPSQDDQEREFCARCGYVHYQNPKVQVGVIVSCKNKMLWMRRATEPRAGFWTLPGGFMEVNESLRSAAARELREETGVVVPLEHLQLYVVGTVGFLDQVHVLFRAQVESEACMPGPEALEVAWFDEERAPWDALAFNDTTPGCRLFYRDVNTGGFNVYYAEQERGGIVLLDIVKCAAQPGQLQYQPLAEDFFRKQ